MRAAKHTYRVALCLNGSIAVKHAGDSGFESQSVPYFFWFIFHKVFTQLGIRLELGLGLVFLGLGIVLVYLAYDAIVLPARDI